MEKWINLAKECGFESAAALDTSTLKTMEMVRDSCAEGKCGAYNHSWTCPPACGTLEECEKRMRSYDHGIIVQTVWTLQKRIDSKGYMEAGQAHGKRMKLLAESIRDVFPNALPLGAGNCHVCEKCAYPDPCRFPNKAMSSMEGYGLFVTQVCRDNNVNYYYGPKTITYTGCILF